MPMKKHEACHHLNNIIHSKRETARRYQEEISKNDQTTFDVETKQQRPATKQEIALHVKYARKELEEVKAELEALDIAASALTK